MKNQIYKIKHWIKRYGPSEILWTIGAIGGGYLGLWLTGSEVAASFFGAWWENIGYYGYNIWQESREQAKLWRHGWKKFVWIVQDVVTEFGFSELLDSFLLRPGLMFFATKYIDNYALWLLVGKILADVVFYVPTTYFYQKTLKRDINILLDKVEDKLKEL